MSPVHLRNLVIPRNQPEDRQGLFRTRRSGNLGHSCGWKDTEVSNTHSAIHLPIQQKPQNRRLEGYGSSSSAQPTPQRSFLMEHGQQGVQPSITLGRTWSKLPEAVSQRDILHRSYGNNQRMESQKAVQTPGGEGNQDRGKSSRYPSYKGTVEPERAYFDSSRFTRSQTTRLPSSFTPFRQQENTSIQGQEQEFFQPKAERVRPNDLEPVGLGKRSTKEPQIVVNTSRISRLNNRNITPTQNENSVVTHENEESQIPGELDNAVKCRCNQSCTPDDIADTLKDARKRKNIEKYSQYKSSSFKEKQPFRMYFKDKPKERVAQMTKKKNSCHNFG
ncbi:hypothetical protein O181_015965 [Austropuccinia psidii MF-1]|uniref:Uncharacterized protein n=1 Tax=Austropuccinia psidii MF-1 TaxID=1389203 RepID=A0A9Q3C4W3_9BASI|nr:hypothetical protein [Austropuccinia psidii MF-1]